MQSTSTESAEQRRHNNIEAIEGDEQIKILAKIYHKRNE